jgi:hypothetical protein
MPVELGAFFGGAAWARCVGLSTVEEGVRLDVGPYSEDFLTRAPYCVVLESDCLGRKVRRLVERWYQSRVAHVLQEGSR